MITFICAERLKPLVSFSNDYIGLSYGFLNLIPPGVAFFTTGAHCYVYYHIFQLRATKNIDRTLEYTMGKLSTYIFTYFPAYALHTCRGDAWAVQWKAWKGYASKAPSKKYPDIVSQTKEVQRANQQAAKLNQAHANPAQMNHAHANPMMTPMAGGHIPEDQIPKVPHRGVKEP